MKPQQFEDMLFSDEPLSAEEREELEVRMQAYPELAVLHKNWSVLKPQLDAAEMAAPDGRRGGPCGESLRAHQDEGG